MTRPMVIIKDLSTGESVEREMNDAEYEQHLKDIADAEERYAQAQAEEEAKAELKSSAIAKLTSLGLTEQEALAIIVNQ